MASAAGRRALHRVRRPSCDELSRLLDTSTGRIVRVLERHGLLIAAPEHPCLDLLPDSSLDHLHAASDVHSEKRQLIAGDQ